VRDLAPFPLPVFRETIEEMVFEALLFTVIGEDRPGLAEALGNVISRHEGIWESSHITRLGGRCAGILEVSVPPNHRDRLAEALCAMEGLTVIFEGDEIIRQTSDWVSFEIDMVGRNRPELIKEISAVLASRGANIAELVTSSEPAPMGGGELFKMRAHVRCPETLDRREVRTALEDIAHEMMVDIAVKE
jgi:glycine cleavage system regulatory protein